MTEKKESQQVRILKYLQAHPNEWVNGRYFLHEMYFSQYHYVIWCLQHRREKYAYDGVIEASGFTDEFGFKSYRLNTGGQSRFL